MLAFSFESRELQVKPARKAQVSTAYEIQNIKGCHKNSLEIRCILLSNASLASFEVHTRFISCSNFAGFWKRVHVLI